MFPVPVIIVAVVTPASSGAETSEVCGRGSISANLHPVMICNLRSPRQLCVTPRKCGGATAKRQDPCQSSHDVCCSFFLQLQLPLIHLYFNTCLVPRIKWESTTVSCCCLNHSRVNWLLLIGDGPTTILLSIDISASSSRSIHTIASIPTTLSAVYCSPLLVRRSLLYQQLST